MRRAIAAWTSGLPSQRACIGVSVRPGRITFERMPSAANWMASYFDSERIAPLDAP